MKIKLILVGKTRERYLQDGIDEYLKRLSKYATVEVVTIAEGKDKNPQVVKDKEATELLQKIDPTDFVVLLDERGKTFTSVKFAEYLTKRQTDNVKTLVFIVGGAYGFAEGVYNRKNDWVRLSDMTFSHQMIRLFFTEQLYRAYTILANHPYHNEG